MSNSVELFKKMKAQNLKLSDERDDLIAQLIQKDEEIKLLKKLAMINPTSMLYNLNYVNAEVERIKSIKEREIEKSPRKIGGYKPEYVFMFFVDIDGLKAINDTHGHATGNAAIKTMGQTLMKITRRCDIAAHLHGDEFVVILMTKERSEGKRLKERIIEITAAIKIENTEITFSASVGSQAAVLSKRFSFEKLMAKADSKMYKEKEEKKKR